MSFIQVWMNHSFCTLRRLQKLSAPLTNEIKNATIVDLRKVTEVPSFWHDLDWSRSFIRQYFSIVYSSKRNMVFDRCAIGMVYTTQPTAARLIWRDRMFLNKIQGIFLNPTIVLILFLDRICLTVKLLF